MMAYETTLEQLEHFAKSFKKRRITLGFAQKDVARVLGKEYGWDVSQTTVSRFEMLNLSYANMCKLKVRLEKWLADVNACLLNPSGSADVQTTPPIPLHPPPLRRRRRTAFDARARRILEKSFGRKPRPTSKKIGKLAEKLGLEREIVRAWFGNRRFKEKKLIGRNAAALPQTSQTTDVTGEKSKDGKMNEDIDKNDNVECIKL